MRPSVHAARNLAIFANLSSANVTTGGTLGHGRNASSYFEQAWHAWKMLPTSDPAKMRLGADLAKEYSSWLRTASDWATLSTFVDSVRVECGSFCVRSETHAEF